MSRNLAPTMDMGMLELSQLRWLQLVSPALPVGMYSYSQGLERAVHEQWVKDPSSARDWIESVFDSALVRLDLPILARLWCAWQVEDKTAVEQWSAALRARREAAELRAEDLQTGQALARVLLDLGIADAAHWLRHPAASFANSWALGSVRFQITTHQSLAGYSWAWLENQVLGAVKLVPLGQSAGQKLLFRLAERIPASVEIALALADDDIGGGAFALAVTSSRHEAQYSRLFRS